MLQTASQETNLYYFNNSGIIATGSEAMLLKLKEGNPIFFTVAIENFKQLLNLAIVKNEGHRFNNCEPFYIPNSFIELHVEKTISFLDNKVALQFRRRADNRGLNIFVCKSSNDVCHELSFENIPEKNEYYNELYIRTKHFDNDLFLSVKPIH